MEKTVFFGQELPNPFAIASGTWGYDINERIAKEVVFTPKSVKYLETPGNPQPRTSEVIRDDILEISAPYSIGDLADKRGMVNCIGLQQPGIDAVIEKYIQQYRSLGAKVILSVAGNAEPDYVYVIVKFGTCEDAVIAYEINVSCPNVERGLVFGTDPDMTFDLVETLRKLTQKPLIVKLTPNVENICDIVSAAIEAGADAISLINTILVKARMKDGREIRGGLSGPMIFPIACGLLRQVRREFPDIPIIAGGGVWSAEDARLMFDLGATLVFVGTLNFTRPDAIFRLIDKYDSLFARG